MELKVEIKKEGLVALIEFLHGKENIFQDKAGSCYEVFSLDNLEPIFQAPDNKTIGYKVTVGRKNIPYGVDEAHKFTSDLFNMVSNIQR